jgi:hypothetical protein
MLQLNPLQLKLLDKYKHKHKLKLLHELRPPKLKQP